VPSCCSSAKNHWPMSNSKCAYSTIAIKYNPMWTLMSDSVSSPFQAWALDIQNRMELVLDGILPSSDIAPQRLHQAMRYAVMGGGKRVRALLSHAAGGLCGADPQKLDIA